MHRITLPLAGLAYVVMMSALPGYVPAWVNAMAGIVGILVIAWMVRREARRATLRQILRAAAHEPNEVQADAARTVGD
jgi:hypothetical protein